MDDLLFFSGDLDELDREKMDEFDLLMVGILRSPCQRPKKKDIKETRTVSSGSSRQTKELAMGLKNSGFKPRGKRSKRKPSSAFDDPLVIRTRDEWIGDDGVRNPTWLVRSEDPFRNPGDTLLPDVISSKFNPNNPSLRIFVRVAERAVKLWNENQKDSGDLLELLEVVSGHESPDLEYHTGHFNFKAVSLHDPNSFPRYFFAEVEAGTWDDDGPDMTCGSRITTCSELKPGSMVNCCDCCSPEEQIYHPLEFVPRYKQLIQSYMLRMTPVPPLIN